MKRRNGATAHFVHRSLGEGVMAQRHTGRAKRYKFALWANLAKEPVCWDGVTPPSLKLRWPKGTKVLIRL